MMHKKCEQINRKLPDTLAAQVNCEAHRMSSRGGKRLGFALRFDA